MIKWELTITRDEEPYPFDELKPYEQETIKDAIQEGITIGVINYEQNDA